MKNVNDLNRTSDELINSPQTQQTISLSALNGDNTKDNTVNISTTNGLSGITEEKVNRPVVRINPSRHRVANPTEVKSIDPSVINEAIPHPAETPSITPRDKAMNLLDQTVRRKREEYKEFVRQAKEDDAINRENVEAGLEEVGEEVQYMPVELQDNSETATVHNHVENNNISKEENIDEYFDDDMSDEDFTTPINTASKVVDPFTIEDDDYGEEVENSDDAEEENYSNAETENYDIEENEKYHNEYTSRYEEENDSTTSENEEDYTNTINDNAITVKNSALEEVNVSSSDFDINEADFEDVTTDTEENLTDDQIMEISNASEKHLKSEILQKIVMTGKKLNIAQLNVSNKVINVKDALRGSESEKVQVAYWPLTFAGRPYAATALKGPEVALLADADTSEQDGVGLSMAQARIMFEHDANPYRPSTIEAWAKTIPFADVENIFAALYLASMKGANYIPTVCPKQSCQYAYLRDDFDINTMVKFDSDESKKNFNNIKATKITAENTGSYESVISVINNQFAVGLKLPSIYTIMYEYNSLNSEFINKYTAMVSIVQYIDYMYKIDEETSTLQPIGWKTYAGDNTKTFKSKIATYAKILKQLDDTDFSVLMALINSMVTKAAEMKNIEFEVPACKCPKCGADIPARPINARGMVFMRQRLVELATTPTVK